MNPLLNNHNPIPSQNGMPPQLRQGIQEIKGFMRMMQSSPHAILQQNPMMSQLNQVAQSFKGQNLQTVYMNMCKERGIDPNVILNELRQ